MHDASSILDQFPFLADTPYTEMQLAKGAWLFREHEGCGRIGFVLDGTVKVFKEHASGRSITLYRLGAGDSCILSMSCAMANPIHQASAVVEDDCRILTVTTDDFRRLMERSAQARDYVFGLFASRLTDVLLLLEEVVFRRMDERLASILLEHAVRLGSDEIHTTHERLAEEAGTAREVVTRVLREFVSTGLVSVGRGVITILDRKGLAHIGR
ncbi:MAG: Crp/Fnr family transcriptional regulator [Candidatus Kapabacteria bacterium]|nr:Crp/Fnr family transcriptional regulator [Candidatus Kapabacteria bacterium]